MKKIKTRISNMQKHTNIHTQYPFPHIEAQIKKVYTFTTTTQYNNKLEVEKTKKNDKRESENKYRVTNGESEF